MMNKINIFKANDLALRALMASGKSSEPNPDKTPPTKYTRAPNAPEIVQKSRPWQANGLNKFFPLRTTDNGLQKASWRSAQNQYGSKPKINGPGDDKNGMSLSKYVADKLAEREQDIPWQAGTNRFESQKGMSAFGAKRNVYLPDDKRSNNARFGLVRHQSDGIVTKNRHLFMHDDPSVPWRSGSNKFASQKGMTAMGSFRNHITKVESEASATKLETKHDESIPLLFRPVRPKWPEETSKTVFGAFRDVNSHVKLPFHLTPPTCKQTETILPLFRQPSVESSSNNAKMHRPRPVELYPKSRYNPSSDGIIPVLANSYRFVPPVPLSHQRLTVTQIQDTALTDKLPYDPRSKLKVAKLEFMPWLTSAANHHGSATQSKMGGFLKKRDVANQTYYDPKPKNIESINPFHIWLRADIEYYNRSARGSYIGSEVSRSSSGSSGRFWD